jgi:putative Mg2+ transporter-C (MgtC) family protein
MTLAALQTINANALVDTVISLSAAFLFGAIIGFEREFRQRTAGLRTNVLVAVGAAIFVDVAQRLTGNDGAVRVAAYVVSGVGFLGAGVIMRDEGGVRGLNTAATLWGSAAVGAAAGSDMVAEAALGCAMVLAANTLLRPLVNRINRTPIDTMHAEVTNTVTVIAPRPQRKAAMQLLEDSLSAAQLPAGDLMVRAFDAEDVAIEMTLLATSVDGEIMDALVERLGESPAVRQAFWSQSTSE